MSKVEDMRGLGPPGAARQLGRASSGSATRPLVALGAHAELSLALTVAQLRRRVAEQDLETAALKRDLASRDDGAPSRDARQSRDAERARRYRERKKAKP